MNKRVDAGTDVAMIGAWDASRQDAPFSRMAPAKLVEAIKEDAQSGHLFLIQTGADGGGPVDVYVDQPPPEQVLARARPPSGEFLLRLPSGRLLIGGAEDYRFPSPQITAAGSLIAVPSGDYLLKCWVANEDESTGPSLAEVEANILSPEDRAYYRVLARRDNWRAACVLLPLLLFPALLPWLGWKIALAIAISGMVPWGHLLDWRWKRKPVDERRNRINKALQDAWLAVQSPTFILELRRVTDTTGLKGGSIRL